MSLLDGAVGMISKQVDMDDLANGTVVIAIETAWGQVTFYVQRASDKHIAAVVTSSNKLEKTHGRK